MCIFFMFQKCTTKYLILLLEAFESKSVKNSTRTLLIFQLIIMCQDLSFIFVIQIPAIRTHIKIRRLVLRCQLKEARNAKHYNKHMQQKISRLYKQILVVSAKLKVLRLQQDKNTVFSDNVTTFREKKIGKGFLFHLYAPCLLYSCVNILLTDYYEFRILLISYF